MSAENIEVVTLSRGVAAEDGPWVAGGGHRVFAPWPRAERECKRRALISLASRETPPDGVAFVRQWEAPVQSVGTSAQVPAVRPAFTPLNALGHDLPKARRGKR